MIRKLKDIFIDEEEQIYCAECGTDIRWWLKQKHIAYYLCNGDVVCSKKCLNEYAIGYFLNNDIIKGI